MKISRSFLELYIILILLVSLFTTLMILLKFENENFPILFIVIGFIFLFVIVFSFIKNFKSTILREEGIVIHRLLIKNILILNEEIVKIEEVPFYFRGSTYSSKVYEGVYLVFKTKNKSIKTSSLNEPDYLFIRNSLKKRFKTKFILSNSDIYSGVSYFYLMLMMLPGLYLLLKVIQKLKVLLM